MPAIMKPSRLASAIKTEALADGGGMTTVSAFVLFDFADPRRLLSEQALWPMVVEQMPEGALFDTGMLKPKGELIVAGAALAPDPERPVTGRHVAARLGTLEKRLAVFGNRSWRLTDRGVEMLPAEPFDRMPVDLAHAFGGPDHKVNPRGKGHGARKLIDAGFDAPLPNVEDPERLIRSPEDRPAPAHFGPLAPDSAERMRHAGTYDRHWLEKIAPARPQDFNPLFYCDAPADQRFEAHFAGDETFAVSGMSRGEAMVTGQLPSLSARAFVHRLSDDSFTEIRMVCETVTLFPNITKAVVTYRGLARSIDRYGEDIGTVLFGLEHAEATPRPADYYLHIFTLRRDPEEGHKHALADFELMPAVDPALISTRRREKLEKARADRAVFLENQNWAARKAVADQGVSPDIVPPVDETAGDDLPLVAMPTAEEIENGDLDLAELLDDVKALEETLNRKRDRDLAHAELQRRRLAASAPAGLLPEVAKRPLVDDDHLARFPDLAIDTDMDAAFDELSDLMSNRGMAPAGLDGDFAGEAFAGLPDEIDRVFAGLEAGGEGDPEAVEVQVAAACARALKLPEGSLLHEARSAIEEMAPEAPPITVGDGDSATRREFADLFAGVKDLKPGAIDAAPGASPGTMFPTDRIEVDTAAAQDGADKAVRAVQALAPGLVPQDGGADPLAAMMAALEKSAPAVDPALADLSVGELLDNRRQEALKRLDAAEVEVDETMATARRMTPTPIYPMEPFLPGVAGEFGAFIRERLAAGHDFRGADLAGAALVGVDFSGLDLAGTCFEQADLSGAHFAGANLEGAVFTAANLEGADLTDTRLVGANLARASLRGAILDRSRIARATLLDTDLTEASGRGLALCEAVLINCTLDGADFGDAALSDLQVMKGSAERLHLDRARVERVSVMVLSLAGASFAEAHLERTSFMDVPAPGVAFAGARLDTVGFFGGSDMSNSRFDGMVATNVSWNATRLTESGFLRARAETCLFNACDMSRSDLRLVSMKNARFDKSMLVDCDLFGANFFAASLGQTDLRRASLRGANLYFANLVEAKLASCDLSGANLGKTILEAASHA